MLAKRNVLLIKEESVYNTDPVPTGAANAVLVENMEWGTEGARMHAREDVAKATLGAETPIYGGHLRTVSFDWRIAGSGTAGTAPRMGDALEACGLLETIVGGTSVGYTPKSSANKSVTIYVYQDGKLIKLTGCRGAVSFAGPAGDSGMVTLTFTGHDAGESDAALPAATYDGTKAPVIKGAAFTIGAYAASIGSLAFDMGNQVATPDDWAGSDGFGEVQVTARRLTGSIDPLAVLKATQDFHGKWTAGTEMALDSTVIGATAGNQWQLTMPKVVYTEYGPAERAGARSYEMGFAGAENAGDDEFQLLFT